MEVNDYIPAAERSRLSPSYQSRKLKWTDECLIRNFLAGSLQLLGMFLRLHQTTIATAQHIMQRFYFRVSLFEVPYRDVLLGAICLAGKLDEAGRSVREVVSCGYQLFHIFEGFRRPVDVLDLGSERYTGLREAALAAERRILTELGYQVYRLTSHPYTYLLTYVEMLGGDRALAQVAWNYVNDSYRTSLCVSFPPHLLAVSAIFLASRKLKSALFHVPTPWWEIFQVSKPDLDLICGEILILYDIQRVYEEDVIELMHKYAKSSRKRSHSPRHRRSRSLSRTRRD